MKGTKTHRCRTHCWNLEPSTPFSPCDNELPESHHTEVVSVLLSTTLGVGGEVRKESCLIVISSLARVGDTGFLC